MWQAASDAQRKYLDLRAELYTQQEQQEDQMVEQQDRMDELRDEYTASHRKIIRMIEDITMQLQRQTKEIPDLVNYNLEKKRAEWQQRIIDNMNRELIAYPGSHLSGEQ